MALRLPRFFLLGAALVLFTGVPSFAEFYTDWLWYEELGYEQVFLKSLSAQATTGMAVGGVVFVILWFNLRLSLRLLRRREFSISTPDGPRVITVDTGRLRSLIYAAALVAAVLIGLYSASSWATWLYAIHATPFGRTDPVLGHDIAFYLFRLPMLELVHGIALTTVILTIAGVAGSHVAAGNLALDPMRGVIASGAARRHLSLLAAALLVVLAFGAWLRIPHLLTEQSGVVFGASYVDVHARMPALRLLAAAALIGAGLAVYQAFAARLPAHRLGHRALHRRRRRRQRLREHRPALHRRSRRAGAGTALHPEQHHRDARRRSGSIAWRSASSRATRGSRGRISSATPRRSRTCRSGTISRCSQTFGADPGDPHVLRLRRGRQRPLHHRRQVPADHAVGARAELRTACRAAPGSTSS